MPTEDLTTLITAHSTTRRTIVKTSAKLAYAVPVIAASMKLGTIHAAATVSGGSCIADGERCFSPSQGLDACNECCTGTSVAAGAFGVVLCGLCLPTGTQCLGSACADCCNPIINADPITPSLCN